MDAWTTNTVQTADRVSAFLWKVYGWMAIGLGLTAMVAFAVASSPDLLRVLVGNRLVFFALVIAELGLVFFLSARADRLAPGTAAGLFAIYSALNGVTLSAVLLAYTGESVTMTFVVTAGMFGALAFFGSTTKRSLAGAGQFFMMGLVGLILASLIGMFWHNDALQFLISIVGVIVFTGLTAWDAQRLKQMALALPEGQVGSYAVVGALSLYLDFINLFLMLLRLTGGRRGTGGDQRRPRRCARVIAGRGAAGVRVVHVQRHPVGTDQHDTKTCGGGIDLRRSGGIAGLHRAHGRRHLAGGRRRRRAGRRRRLGGRGRGFVRRGRQLASGRVRRRARHAGHGTCRAGH